MNLSTLTLAQLKATAAKYALQVNGDKRLRSTWENALELAGEFIAAQVDAVKDAAIELAQRTFTNFCFKELQTMQPKELLMTNSFPIVLETQIADDLKTFGFLPDDTARAIDCANADTFCKTANLADIKSQTTAIAVQTFQEIATYDNAVIAANTLNVVTRRVVKFTLKAMWSVFLVSIALSCIALDLWQNRAETKAFLVQVMANVKTKAIAKVKDRWVIWTEMGVSIVQIHITEPVNEMRDRLNTAKSALLN